MNRRTFIGAFASVWALTRSGLERLGQSYKGAAESNQNLGRLRLADRLLEPDLISEWVHHGKGAIAPPLVS